MYRAEDLEAAISSFISENRAFLSATSAAASRHDPDRGDSSLLSVRKEAPEEESHPALHHNSKYIGVTQGEHDAARTELLKATELLQESLREWNQERKAHQETKQLLLLALRELRDGGSSGGVAVGHSSTSVEQTPYYDGLRSDAGGVPHATYRQQPPQPLTSEQQQRYPSSTGVASPISFSTATSGALGSASKGSRILESMLMQAAPTIIDNGGRRSPVRGTPPRTQATGGGGGFSSPYSAEAQRRLHRALQLDSAAGASAQYQKPRAATPPFQSGASRFRDMVPAGDQLIYETRSGNSVGLQYKKSSDVKPQRRSNGGSAGDATSLTAYASKARSAVEDLQRRLTQQQHQTTTREHQPVFHTQQQQQQPYNPATPTRKGNSTLYSPR